MKPAPSSVCRTDWRTSYRRATDAAALTLFFGPPLGGIVFGIIGDINHFALLAGGHLPWLHATFTDELVVVFVWPIAAAFAALIVPAAWLAAATASVYVAVASESLGASLGPKLLFSRFSVRFLPASLFSTIFYRKACAPRSIFWRAQSAQPWPCGTSPVDGG